MINVADFLLGLVTGAVLAFLFEVWLRKDGTWEDA
jgi:hypothetical protein